MDIFNLQQKGWTIPSYFPGLIDEKNTPPCEALRPHPDPCGSPSTWRLYGGCSSCGNHGYFFVCDPCLSDMETGVAGCSACLAMNTITVART